jgi:hypothetical protein
MPFIDEEIAPEERPPGPLLGKKPATSKVNTEPAADAVSLGIAVFLLLCLATAPIMPWLGIHITAIVFPMQVSARLSANAAGRTWMSEQSAYVAPGVDPKVRMGVVFGRMLGMGSTSEKNMPVDLPQGFGVFFGPQGQAVAESGLPKATASDRAWEGWTILGVSGGLAVLAGLALVAYVAIRPGPTEAGYLVAVSSLVGGGWASMTAIWMAGYICKILLVRLNVNRAIETARQSSTENMVASLDLHMSTYPGIGLWAGLFFATAIAVVCAMLAARKPQGVLAAAGYSAGVTAGMLMLAIHVKPWTVME